jgi:hypothetical protein
MRIYKSFGALSLAPENEEEVRALALLLSNVKFGAEWDSLADNSVQEPANNAVGNVSGMIRDFLAPNRDNKQTGLQIKNWGKNLG